MTHHRLHLSAAMLLGIFTLGCTAEIPVEEPPGPDPTEVSLLDDLQVRLQDVALNPEDLQMHIHLAVALQELERPLEAAEQFEICATLVPEEEQRNYWQRASRLRELGGDMPQALADLERALQGTKLKDSEQRLLERLQAYERGKFEHPEDAVQVLRHHAGADFRYQAALYLAKLDFAADAATFADALTDADGRISVLAARELAMRGSEMDVPALYLALDHADPDAQIAATRCLGQLGGRESVAEVLIRLDPANRTLFRIQRQALFRLTSHSVSLDLDPDEEQRKIITLGWQDWWNESS